MAKFDSTREEKKKYNKKILWGKIKSPEMALLVAKETAKGFYLLAALQAVIGLILSLYNEFGLGLIVDGVIFAVLAWLMQKFMSRLAAGVLLIISFLALFSTFLNLIGQNTGGGSNFVLAAIIFYLAVRSVQATWVYNSQEKESGCI